MQRVHPLDDSLVNGTVQRTYEDAPRQSIAPICDSRTWIDSNIACAYWRRDHEIRIDDAGEARATKAARRAAGAFHAPVNVTRARINKDKIWSCEYAGIGQHRVFRSCAIEVRAAHQAIATCSRVAFGPID